MLSIYSFVTDDHSRILAGRRFTAITPTLCELAAATHSRWMMAIMECS